MAYNAEHGIVPQTVKKEVRDIIDLAIKDKDGKGKKKDAAKKMSAKDLEKTIAEMTAQMKEAAATLNFELAAALRDKITALKKANK